MFYVEDNSIASVWEESIRHFLRLSNLYYSDSRLGFCLEAQGVTITSNDPASIPQISPKYLFPQLLPEYQLKLEGEIPEISTTYDRMYKWSKRNGVELDQMERIRQILENDPFSRAAVVSIWDPDYDLYASNPISPCMLSFSVKNEKLNLIIIARSSDAWVSALPEMIAFSQIQIRQANRLQVGVGRLMFHALSYHIYEHDLPIVKKKFT
jgi:thymidylate synthase